MDRCWMQQCCIGLCLMLCMSKALLSIDSPKAYGLSSLFTRTRCVMNLFRMLKVRIDGVNCETLYRFAYVEWIVEQVGLVLDCGIEEELRLRHLQVADAARASLGLPVVEYVVTETPLQVSVWLLRLRVDLYSICVCCWILLFRSQCVVLSSRSSY